MEFAYGGELLIAVLRASLLATLIGIVAGIPLAALTLKFSLQVIEKLPLSYGRAFLTTLVSLAASSAANGVVGVAVGLCISFAAGGSLGALFSHAWLLILFGIPLGFAINAAVVNALVKHTDGHPMGFPRACLVTLLQSVINLALGLVIVGLLVTTMGWPLPMLGWKPH